MIIKKGGLKMVDLESYIKAQKIMCLKKYCDTYFSTWKNILDAYLKNVGCKLLLRCQFDVPKLPLEIPYYYKGCLQVWSSLLPPQPDNDIAGELLWNNKLILINAKSVYNKRLAKKEIMLANDLLSTNGGFATLEELVSRSFTITESFLIMGLIDALPSLWRKELKKLKRRQQDEMNHRKIAGLYIKDKFTTTEKLKQKHVYTELVSNKTSKPTAQKRFSEIYPNHEFDWKSIYLLPWKVSTEVKIKVFQYKILNRILYTNKALFKMKLSDTDKCTFCKEEIETIEHLLVSCKYTSEFWNQITEWLKVKNIYEELNELAILFGILNSDDFKLINHIILIAKETIYKCRNKNLKPSFTLFLSRLRHIHEIEKTIAQGKGASETEQFICKWEKLD